MSEINFELNTAGLFSGKSSMISKVTAEVKTKIEEKSIPREIHDDFSLEKALQALNGFPKYTI